MLFNSAAFILGFVPVTLIVFFVIGSRHQLLAAAWLTAASLFFYGWWNPAYVPLLVMSIAFNYALGTWLMRGHAHSLKRLVLFAGVGANLALLGYFKYTGFIAENLSAVLHAHWDPGQIVLPLGISFFTFTQIAFLVDAYRGDAKYHNPVHYGLFVTYFPHLIAGPIFHHKEIIPQFARPAIYRVSYENLAVGISIFVFGLFKKVILADKVAPYADRVFDAAARGEDVTLVEAWGGALSYSLQLYFDFSGYSDMAIGLSKMFGVRLPLNFFSPYRAESIIDFWRRWHMTLSRFLRNYLYLPLGGNRRGEFRRYLNIAVTMVLGGLWHGASWTFVVWGALHGIYLTVNHLWRAWWVRRPGSSREKPLWARALSILLTFLAVTLAWVFFRAENIDSAVRLVTSMMGFNGLALPGTFLQRLGWLGGVLTDFGVSVQPLPLFGGRRELFLIAVLLAVVWFMPNTQEIMRAYQPALPVYGEIGKQSRQWPEWNPTVAWCVALNLACLASLWTILSRPESPFLYFNF